MRVGLEFLRAAIYWSPATLVAREYTCEPLSDLLAHLKEVHHLAGTGRAFDLEIIAIIEIEILKCPDDERVYRKPHRAPPIGVTTKHSGI